MENIRQGVVSFINNKFQNNKKLFEELKNGQNPHTLFVCCCDSRIIPSLITKSKPGELFVVRNIANIIPPYSDGDDYLDTTSAIEYALNFLDIKNIVICGHSDCGGCKAIYKDEKDFENFPNIKKWLKLLYPIKEKFLKQNINISKRSHFSERLNLLNSYENLIKYPYIKDLLFDGKINIYLWHYVIENGEIYDYDFKTKEFILIKGEA